MNRRSVLHAFKGLLAEHRAYPMAERLERRNIRSNTAVLARLASAGSRQLVLPL